MAVPGSPRNRAAEGTNALIADGVAPVRDATDVLVALGLTTGRTGAAPRSDRPALAPREQEVLDLFSDAPLDLEHLLAVSGRDMGSTVLSLARLEADGWLLRTGGWFERAPEPAS
jgi:predicted Rossmann fold nucleotide-binding protein DprA/Smf involved in DNA uptake